MEDLVIEATEESPAVHLQAGGELTFSGRSFPEDAQDFFAPVLNWLDEYKNSPANSTVATFNISYFNSSSDMLFLKILTALEAMHQTGTQVQVIWMHAVGDHLMAERAEELGSMVDLPFEIKEG